MKSKLIHVVGIDEVGRGPLAGPVAVCSLCLKNGFQRNKFKKFKDSKKLSPTKRIEWLKKIDEERQKGNIIYKVCFESNKIIDEKGLSFAINRALKKSLYSLKIKSEDCQILLDGGLRAPVEFINQKTIIKGDEKELAIALSSIVAKVTRDRLIIKESKKYLGYGLEKHKGYGTKDHIKSIKKLGLSPIHRVSFCKGMVKK